MSTDVYVITRHKVGQVFEPPDEHAVIVKGCGTETRQSVATEKEYPGQVTYVLVMWAYPRR